MCIEFSTDYNFKYVQNLNLSSGSILTYLKFPTMNCNFFKQDKNFFCRLGSWTLVFMQFTIRLKNLIVG